MTEAEEYIMYLNSMVGRPFHQLVSNTLILLVFFMMGVRQAEANDPCGDVTQVHHSDDFYGEALAAGEVGYFKMTLPSPGVLMVDVAVSPDSPAEVKLGHFSCGRAPSPKGDLVVIRQSVSAMLLAAGSAGTYIFGVAAQDPESALDSHRIRTRFVDEHLVSADKTEAGDRDNEPLLDGLRHAGLSSSEPSFQLTELCRNLDEDANGTDFCATPVTTHYDAVADLHDGGNEDVDVYTFTLTRQRTVRVETGGETDTVGGLYDRWGHRLASDDDGGDGNNFRLVKTLGPGEYFVRVAGRDGAEGPYRLVVEALTW